MASRLQLVDVNCDKWSAKNLWADKTANKAPLWWITDRYFPTLNYRISGCWRVFLNVICIKMPCLFKTQANYFQLSLAPKGISFQEWFHLILINSVVHGETIWWPRSVEHWLSNGLLPDITKPLTEPILRHHQMAPWHPLYISFIRSAHDFNP